MYKPPPSIQNTIIFSTSCAKAHDCFSNVCIHSPATTASLSFVHVVIYFTMCLFALYTWIFAPQSWHPVVIINLLIPHTCFSPPDGTWLSSTWPLIHQQQGLFWFEPKGIFPSVSCCNKADKKTQAAYSLSLMQFKETWPRVLEYTVMLLLQWRRILLSSSRISTLLM